MAGGHNVLVETGFNLEIWQVGWIFKDAGSLRRTAEGFTVVSTSNGPMNLG